MPSKALDVGAQLVDGLPCTSVVQTHVGDGSDVDLGPIQLSHRGAQHLASFVGGPRFGELKDGVAHASKLGAALLGPRLGKPWTYMNVVWVLTRSINLGTDELGFRRSARPSPRRPAGRRPPRRQAP